MTKETKEEMDMWARWRAEDELVLVVVKDGVARVIAQPDSISVAIVDLDADEDDAQFSDANGEGISGPDMLDHIFAAEGVDWRSL